MMTGPYGEPTDWPTSIRCPSGSRMYALISRPWSFGSVRNSAPLADHSRYAFLNVRVADIAKALVRSGSGGVVSVTVGLSSVGPPPSLRISHVLATFMM